MSVDPLKLCYRPHERRRLKTAMAPARRSARRAGFNWAQHSSSRVILRPAQSRLYRAATEVCWQGCRPVLELFHEAYFIALEVDVEQHTDRHEARDQARAPVGDEGQRNARDGHDADRSEEHT